VGFFGFGEMGSDSFSSSSDDAILESFGGPYSIVSDRAVFVHHFYIDSLPSYSTDSCCQTLLSMQLSVASEKSPVVMKANPRELLQIKDSTTSLRRSSDTQASSCISKCITDWMQRHGVESLPHADASVLA
jgi:hypothetical protein